MNILSWIESKITERQARNTCWIFGIIAIIVMILIFHDIGWCQSAYLKRIAHLDNSFDEPFDSVVDNFYVNANLRTHMVFDTSLLPVDTYIQLHGDTVYSRQTLYYYQGESHAAYGPLQMIYKRIGLEPVDIRYGLWLEAPDSVYDEELDLYLIQVYYDTVLRNTLTFITGFPIDTFVLLGRDSTYNLFFYYSYVGYGTLDGGEIIVPHQGLNAILGPIDSNACTVYQYLKWPSGNPMEGAMVRIIPATEDGKFFDTAITPTTAISRTAMVAFTNVDGLWQMPLKQSATYEDTVYYQVVVTDVEGDEVFKIDKLFVPSQDSFNVSDR